MHADPEDSWRQAATWKENRVRNCRAPSGPPPYNGLRQRPDMADEANPGGVFAVRGNLPKPITAEALQDLLAAHDEGPVPRHEHRPRPPPRQDRGARCPGPRPGRAPQVGDARAAPHHGEAGQRPLGHEGRGLGLARGGRPRR
eukprot:9118580-Alexandrium_andersonii.AAC.1